MTKAIGATEDTASGRAARPTAQTAFRQALVSHRSTWPRVSAEDGAGAHPAVRILLRGTQGPCFRPPPAVARIGRRGRLPGDVPAGASRLSGAATRTAPARLGVHDRNTGRDRRDAPDAAPPRPPRARRGGPPPSPRPALPPHRRP